MSALVELVRVGRGYLRTDVPVEAWGLNKHLLWMLEQSSDASGRFVIYSTKGRVVPHPEISIAVAVLHSHGISVYWKRARKDPYYPIRAYEHSMIPRRRRWLVLPKARKIL